MHNTVPKWPVKRVSEILILIVSAFILKIHVIQFKQTRNKCINLSVKSIEIKKQNKAIVGSYFVKYFIFGHLILSIKWVLPH